MHLMASEWKNNNKLLIYSGMMSFTAVKCPYQLVIESVFVGISYKRYNENNQFSFNRNVNQIFFVFFYSSL